MYKNLEMEQMLEALFPILPHRDKVGYVAARNTRKLTDALTEYFKFKNELINKYGEVDKDEDGNDKGTISIAPNSPNLVAFTDEFDKIKDIEHDVDLMTISYAEVIGLLNGEEILKLDFMLEE